MPENGLMSLEESRNYRVRELRGGILAAGTYSFVFDNNPGIQTQQINPPAGWQFAVVSLGGWELKFRDGEDHQFGLAKVFVWAGNQGGGAQFSLRAQMHLRDDNGDDYWRGEVQATVIFYA